MLLGVALCLLFWVLLEFPVPCGSPTFGLGGVVLSCGLICFGYALFACLWLLCLLNFALFGDCLRCLLVWVGCVLHAFGFLQFGFCLRCCLRFPGLGFWGRLSGFWFWDLVLTLGTWVCRLLWIGVIQNLCV